MITIPNYQIPNNMKSIRTELLDAWSANEGSGVKHVSHGNWKYTRSQYVMFALPDLSKIK